MQSLRWCERLFKALYACYAALLYFVDIMFIRRYTDDKAERIKLSIFSALIMIAYCVIIILKNINLIYGSFVISLVSVMVLVTIYDIKTKRIPNILLIMINGVGFISSFFVPDGYFIYSIAAAWAIAGICFVVGKKTGGGIGSGDILCMSGLMMSMNFTGMMNYMFASLFLGVIFSVASLLMKKTTLKTEIPFAPFMFAGYFCMMIFI